MMLKMMGQELSLIADDDLSINSSNIFDVGWSDYIIIIITIIIAIV